jgi:hypothetical protein
MAFETPQRGLILALENAPAKTAAGSTPRLLTRRKIRPVSVFFLCMAEAAFAFILFDYSLCPCGGTTMRWPGPSLSGLSG